jgi:peptidoglycan/LPS O-acetylase OafA/YrhL
MAASTLPHNSNLILTSPDSSESWHRLDGVDLLRGLAILFVVLNHVHMRLLIAGIPYVANSLKPLVAALVWNGQFGVQIFFAVSGFLITSMTLRRWRSLANVAIRDFYLLRFARIAPLLIVLLLILTVLHYAGIEQYVVSQKTGGIHRALLAALTFHVNVLQSRRGWLPANWGILWSLSVEEMFYLFFPLLARFLGRNNFFIFVLFGFVALGPFARTIFAHGNEIWSEQSYLGGMDAIALGCLTALATNRVEFSRRTLHGLWVAGAIIISFILFGLRLAYLPIIGELGLDMTIIALGTCMIIIPAAQIHWRAPLLLAPLLHLGRRSYEIYLTHMFVVFAFFGIFLRYGSPAWSVPLLFLFTIIAIAVVGHIVARLFSEPMNRYFRQRYISDRASPRTVASS